MALQAISSPLLWPGFATCTASAYGVGTSSTLTATGHYVAWVFQAREAMTISHIGLRTGTVGSSPTATVQLESVATDGAPSGTILGSTNNAKKAMGALTSSTWGFYALDESATIAAGSLFAVKVLWGSGSVIIATAAGVRTNTNLPYIVTNITGSAVKTNAGTAGFLPNIALGSSATTFYRLPLLTAFSAAATANLFNSGTATTIARGVKFQLPFRARCCGFTTFLNSAIGDITISLQNNSNVELSSSSTALDGDQWAASPAESYFYFDNPVVLEPNTPYRAIYEPTSVTNTNIHVLTTNNADLLAANPGGANFVYTTRSGSTWTDSTTQYPLMNLLLDQFSDDIGSGGGASFSRIQGGF